jgi:hypothetical protein
MSHSHRNRAMRSRRDWLLASGSESLLTDAMMQGGTDNRGRFSAGSGKTPGSAPDPTARRSRLTPSALVRGEPKPAR